jgi:ubiquinone/menaquinone biosynthesis C-methylase UbiE
MPIDAKQYFNTDRGLWELNNGNEIESPDFYPKALGFQNKKEFLTWIDGTMVLDLGSGFDKLSQDVELEKKRGNISSNTKIIGLNISLADPQFRMVYEKKLQEQGAVNNAKPTSVAARWDQLPFADASFKKIVSHYAFPLWCKSRKELIDTVRELKRVLISGGEIRFQDTKNFSFPKTDISESGTDFFNYFVKALTAEGLKVVEVPAGSLSGKMGVEMALSVIKP